MGLPAPRQEEPPPEQAEMLEPRPIEDQPVAIDPDDEADRVPDEELGAFLGLWSEEAHARALELRELVLSVAPFAEERLIRGWKVVAYDHDGLIAYIKPRHDAVHLGFYDGVNLPDPHGHLEGSGKYRRHLVIDLTASLDRPVILELLRPREPTPGPVTLQFGRYEPPEYPTTSGTLNGNMLTNYQTQ